MEVIGIKGTIIPNSKYMRKFLLRPGGNTRAEGYEITSSMCTLDWLRKTDDSYCLREINSVTILKTVPHTILLLLISLDIRFPLRSTWG